MSDIYSANADLYTDLNGVHEVVVQKGNVGSSYIYALQLLKQGTDAVVYRAKKGSSFKKGAGQTRLYLNGHKTNGSTAQTAGGHTQTWEYAGDKAHKNYNGEWFIGTKSKIDTKTGIAFDTQIARVGFGKHEYKHNTQLTRISNLNQAGNKFGIAYSGDKLLRSEAAVSPNYEYFLIATVDTDGNGYFSIYNLADINSELNRVGTGDVNLKENQYLRERCVSAFKVTDFVGKVGSIQGYDIDNDMNIYISSEAHPDKNNIVSKPKKIVKMPWNTKERSQWDFISLDNNRIIDKTGYATELEGIQVSGLNELYLTVAYHDHKTYTTKYNKIFKVKW